MAQIDSERFFTMAEAYDKMAPYLVPGYEMLQTEAVRIIPYDQDEAFLCMDLGAGSGRLLERVLTEFPKAKALWVDYSEDFLAIARERLKKFEGRVRFEICRIEDEWEGLTDEKPGVIFSMSAIHHLEDNEKKSLYARCYRALQKDGMFLNIDEVKPYSEEAYVGHMRFWADYVDGQKENVPSEFAVYYDKWMLHFDRWKIRNIENRDLPKQKGDDLHAPVADQLDWLKEAGFQGVDAFVKYYLWAIMGGRA